MSATLLQINKKHELLTNPFEGVYILEQTAYVVGPGTLLIVAHRNSEPHATGDWHLSGWWLSPESHENASWEKARPCAERLSWQAQGG